MPKQFKEIVLISNDDCEIKVSTRGDVEAVHLYDLAEVVESMARRKYAAENGK